MWSQYEAAVSAELLYPPVSRVGMHVATLEHGGQQKLEGNYGYEGQKNKAPHFFPLPCGFFDGPFPWCLL